MKTIVFLSRDYITFNYLPQIINNAKKFCVHGNSILRVETTFELIDVLWLTDATYTIKPCLTNRENIQNFLNPVCDTSEKIDNVTEDFP